MGGKICTWYLITIYREEKIALVSCGLDIEHALDITKPASDSTAIGEGVASHRNGDMNMITRNSFISFNYWISAIGGKGKGFVK